jgi:hypothetical protein
MDERGKISLQDKKKRLTPPYPLSLEAYIPYRHPTALRGLLSARRNIKYGKFQIYILTILRKGVPIPPLQIKVAD